MRKYLAVLACVMVSRPLAAQTPQQFTLDQAIQYAADHYPTVRAAIEQANASEAGVAIARGAYLPRLDSLWQSNRGTVNNVFGQVLPQSVIPSMSGPVLPSATGSSVWGSAVGALLSWEPFDFGLRRAGVDSAQTASAEARADEALTRLEVERAVGDVFLNLAAEQRAVSAAQADFDRRNTLARSVHTLVDNQLRPGADASRADAEQAAAQTRLIQAKAALTVGQTTLLRVLGMTSGTVTIDAGRILERPPAAAGQTAPASGHPLAVVRQSAVERAKAQQEVLGRTDWPRLYVQSSIFARGTGANLNGQLDGGLDGLGLDRVNWAAGIQILFPNVFDFSSLHAREAAAAASERASAALYDEALLTISNGQQTAAAEVQAAREVAANTPVQLMAAQQSEIQARARYDAGLASIIEVADAQGLLAQAEVQDQIARVDVWRALLESAAAEGDLTPFLTLVRQP